LRDVLRTLANRMPNVPVVLYPVPVQGADAGQKIAQMIATANRRAECDVLILCRGGGSIEDLWAFNEEAVARAIAASAIPVVSGVGHETDFTIADFVADLRAATPTAAAQAVVPERQALRRHLAQQQQHLAQATLRQFERRMQQLDYLQRRLVHPAQRIRQQADQLEGLHRRLRLAQGSGLQQAQWRWQTSSQRLRRLRPDVAQRCERLAVSARHLNSAMTVYLARQDARLLALHQHVQYLDPQQVLARGYSVVRDAAGQVVSSSAAIAVGDNLQLIFAQGGAMVAVRKIHEAP